MRKSAIIGAAMAASGMASAAVQPRKIYGAGNIKRHIQTQKNVKTADGSIATQPHDNSREAQRRLRQEQRRAAKAAAK